MGPHHVTPRFPKVKWLGQHRAALPLGHGRGSIWQPGPATCWYDERNPVSTSWYVVYPIIYKVYIYTIYTSQVVQWLARFLPSTVGTSSRWSSLFFFGLLFCIFFWCGGWWRGCIELAYWYLGLSLEGYSISHRIHVWYIYLHLVDFYGKCS